MNKPLCQQCGAVIEWAIRPAHSKTGRGRFCSKDCANKAMSKIPESEWPELVRLYQGGMTSNQIGALYGCTGTVVLKTLRRFPGVLRYAKPGEANGMYGRTHTPEAREKIRAANIRQFSTQESRNRHAELTAKQIEQGHTGKTHNKLERAFAAILDSIGVRYQWQARLGRYVFDFLLTDTGIMVEVHGTFWHADPRFYSHTDLKPSQIGNVANDAKKHQSAIDAGYRYLQFWEHDIYNDPSAVANSVLSAIAK